MKFFSKLFSPGDFLFASVSTWKKQILILGQEKKQTGALFLVWPVAACDPFILGILRSAFVGVLVKRRKTKGKFPAKEDGCRIGFFQRTSAGKGTCKCPEIPQENDNWLFEFHRVWTGFLDGPLYPVQIVKVVSVIQLFALLRTVVSLYTILEVVRRSPCCTVGKSRAMQTRLFSVVFGIRYPSVWAVAIQIMKWTKKWLTPGIIFFRQKKGFSFQKEREWIARWPGSNMVRNGSCWPRHKNGAIDKCNASSHCFAL